MWRASLFCVAHTSSVFKVIKSLSSGNDLGDVLLHDAFNLKCTKENHDKKIVIALLQLKYGQLLKRLLSNTSVDCDN